MSQNPQSTPTKRLARTERRLKVLELAQQGHTTREIAAQIGVSHGTVANDVHAALTELADRQAQETEHFRALELARLDQMQAGVWEAALAGKISAIECVLGISARRAKLMGLDKPVQVDLSAEVEHHVEEIVKVLEAVLPPDLFRRALEAISA